MTTLEFDVADHIAVLKLNRPEARNALSPELLVRLDQSLREVRDCDAVRVAVITAAGDKAFCAGADLALAAPLLTGGRQPEDDMDLRFMALWREEGGGLLMRGDVGKPLIAAVNGDAIAGGLELLLGTDIRVAVPSARFGLQEVRWGLVPGGGGTVRLPRQIPQARAMELLLTGELVGAEEAYALGLVNRIAEPAALFDEAMAVAGRIAANGPLAVAAIRKSVREGADLPFSEAMALEAKVSQAVAQSEDAIEGPRAFMEKRAPRFRGR